VQILSIQGTVQGLVLTSPLCLKQDVVKIFFYAATRIFITGRKKNGFQALATPPEFAQYFDPNPPPPYLYADYNSKAKLNYLMLSVLAKFNWQLGTKSPASFYADAGPFGALLVSAHQVTSGSSIIYIDEQMQQQLTPDAQSFDNKEDIKSDLHKGNFGIEGDLGLAFNFKNNRLFVEGGANYGFLNIQKGTDNGKNNTGAATIRIGYACNFGKVIGAKEHS